MDIKIIKDVPDEDMRWFSAQYPQHNVVGFMEGTYENGGSRVILKMKPGYKAWTPYMTARDCGDHYILAQYDRYDRVEKNGLRITKDVTDR